MNKHNSVFIHKLCRLCLDNAGVLNVFDSSDLLEDIYTCTGVYISPSDNLPHEICNKCSGVVKEAKELRILATKNEAHLNFMFNNSSEDDIIQLSGSKTTENEPEPGPEKVSADVSFERGEKDINILIKTEVNTNSPANNDCKTGSTILQKISLRKDLFYSASSPATSSIKTESQSDDDPHELLEAKVRNESQCKKLKTDDDDTDYVCGMCNKLFVNQKKLYLHQRFHNKKYICKESSCKKKFGTKSDLVKHVRTHTGEKPFTCDVCNKGFSQRVSLRLHVAMKHTKDSDGD